MSARISAAQAWCKFAVLIADGLPAPKSIRFGGNPIIVIDVDGQNALTMWRVALGIDAEDTPITTTDGDGWILGSSTLDWNGYYVRVGAVIPREVGTTQPVDDDMSSVRAVAESTSDSAASVAVALLES